jgi:hypothetical protein
MSSKSGDVGGVGFTVEVIVVDTIGHGANSFSRQTTLKVKVSVMHANGKTTIYLTKQEANRRIAQQPLETGG